MCRPRLHGVSGTTETGNCVSGNSRDEYSFLRNVEGRQEETVISYIYIYI